MIYAFFVFTFLVWCLGDSICKRIDLHNHILKDIADSLEQISHTNQNTR